MKIILLFLFALFSSLSNPSNQTSKDDQDQSHASGTLFDYGPFWPHRFHHHYWNQEPDDGASQGQGNSDGWTANDTLTLLLVIAAGVQATIYWLQWRKMRETLEHSRESSERALRAYLVPIHSKYDLPDVKETEISGWPDDYAIFVKNCGQTPAYEVLTWFEWRSFPGCDVHWPKDVSFINVSAEPNPARGSSATLGSGSIMKPTFPLGDRLNGQMFKEELKKFMRDEVTIFLHGVICYKDIFNRRTRATKFCTKMKRNGSSTAFNNYDLHNEAD
jgi:hypothetical protein